MQSSPRRSGKHRVLSHSEQDTKPPNGERQFMEPTHLKLGCSTSKNSGTCEQNYERVWSEKILSAGLICLASAYLRE